MRRRCEIRSGCRSDCQMPRQESVADRLGSCVDSSSRQAIHGSTASARFATRNITRANASILRSRWTSTSRVRTPAPSSLPLAVHHAVLVRRSILRRLGRGAATQNIRDSLFGASALDGARGTLLFYGPSQLKQVFVELMMLARRPRPNSPAWHEFFGHARIYPNHCVFNLDQHGCGLNASTWPRFTGNKTWEGGDDFVPHVFELQLRPELRVAGVFNAFRFQASPHGLAQLGYLIKTNGVNAVIFYPPHPNRYYQTQCCTSDAPVCDSCGQHNGVQRSQLERLFSHQKLPALLTGSWESTRRLADGEGGPPSSPRRRMCRRASPRAARGRSSSGVRSTFGSRFRPIRTSASKTGTCRAAAPSPSGCWRSSQAADRPRLPARPRARAGDADRRMGPNSA